MEDNRDTVSNKGQDSDNQIVINKYADQRSYIEGIKDMIAIKSIGMIQGNHPVVEVVFDTENGPIVRSITPSGLLVAIQNYYQQEGIRGTKS